MTTLATLGHSTRAFQPFLDTLRSFEIRALVDVRRYPSSRRNPQYATEGLKKGLFHAGIEYVYLGDELGGMRKPTGESRHPWLKGSGFQSYADWMDGDLFRRGVDALLTVAEAAPTATMCAERDPSACHRHLLSDYLVLVHGLDVQDLLDPGLVRPHKLTPGVRRDATGIRYTDPKGSAPLDAFPSAPDR